MNFDSEKDLEVEGQRLFVAHAELFKCEPSGSCPQTQTYQFMLSSASRTPKNMPNKSWQKSNYWRLSEELGRRAATRP